MARKKSRQAPPPTAVVAQSTHTGVKSIPNVLPYGSSKTMTEPESFWSTPLGRILHRVFRAFGALQMAICLMVLFTASMIVATILESWHSAGIAQQLVYETWWFTLLLVILGTNIICAALKKMDPVKLSRGHWPWKKYQTGFLVTHVGLITLVFGGLLTALGGVEGQLIMIDTRDPDVLAEVSHMYSNPSRNLYRTDQHKMIITSVTINEKANHARLMEVVKKARGGQPLNDRDLKDGHKQWVEFISPGHLPWYDEDGYKSNLTGALKALRNVAAPIRGWSRDLDDLDIRVQNYFPHSERWDLRPASEKSEHSFPALQVRFESRLSRTPIDRWVIGVPHKKGPPETILLAHLFMRARREQSRGMGPSFGAELMTCPDDRVLRELLSPPRPQDQGHEGQVVLFWDGVKEPLRVPLNPGKLDSFEWKDAGATVKVLEQGNMVEKLPAAVNELFGGHGADPKELDDLRKLVQGWADQGYRYPFVRYEISANGQKREFVASARTPNLSGPVEEGKGLPVVACYHYPDGLFGEARARGGVHFLQAPDGRMYYRSCDQVGLFSAETGEIDPKDETASFALPWRSSIRTSFSAIGWLERATEGEHLKPRNLKRVGGESRKYNPALKGVITHDGKDHPFETRMFEGAEPVRVGDRLVFVVYAQDVRALDFEVTLNRARDVKDPGTNRPGEFESEITVRPLNDPKAKPFDFKLYMNHTLDYGGYRFFQANFEETDYEVRDPKTGLIRYANHSGIQLSHDPGLMFKYVGTGIVVLGIVIMFYMKAYFFKPRRRSAVAA